MYISVSNILINYFLTHPQRKKLTFQQLKILCDKISKNFQVTITQCQKNELKQIIDIFSDFLSIDQEYTIYQNNILQYLNDLQQVYSYFNFNKWQKQYQYYKFLRQN